jgi:hypothetical protein
LAKTLDIVYKSDEKDRLVVPLLNNLMSNIWPFLKTHLIANKHNFYVASQLLMNLTTYPYTRKTWKKEVFDALFDSSYFYVDSETLYNYKVIIDNLISNDRAMFKDVIVRVTYPQSSGLFTSREQESEQRSQLLKRLAFVIYASEKDQYQKNMPEIQECIAQMLKNVQSTNLYSTIFLLFRVLLLRVSSRHLIALWPTILSELLLILLQMEQDLTEEMDPNRSSKPTTLEALTYPVTNLSSLTSFSLSKFGVYLSACKLIDLILTLPYALTAQFQLYKWSFMNGNDVEAHLKDQFVPYMTRIAHLLQIRVRLVFSRPLFRISNSFLSPTVFQPNPVQNAENQAHWWAAHQTTSDAIVSRIQAVLRNSHVPVILHQCRGQFGRVEQFEALRADHTRGFLRRLAQLDDRVRSTSFFLFFSIPIFFSNSVCCLL